MNLIMHPAEANFWREQSGTGTTACAIQCQKPFYGLACS